jgi:hypothetical protein
MKIEIAEKAAALGYKAIGESDPNQTLAEIIASRELRYWEAFPVLLANAAEGGKFSHQAAAALLPEEDKKYLKLLIIISLGLYDTLGARFAWRERLFGDLPARLIAGFRGKIEGGAELELGYLRLAPARLKDNFAAAFGGSGAVLKGAAKAREEEGLEAALSQLFTPRQRELLMKKLRREPLTKTEKEYFSRVVKKKARAIANEELHRLARRALA